MALLARALNVLSLLTLIRLNYASILGKLRTQPRRRRYRSSQNCVSMSNTARSRPREEHWVLWFCGNEHGGSTSPTCPTERRTTSWTCPLSQRWFLVPRWPQCNGGVKPKRRNTKFSSSASLKRPQLPLPLHSARPSRRLLLRSRSWRYLNCRSSSPPQLPCPVGLAGPRSPRPWLQHRRHSQCKLPRPGRRRERPDCPFLHRWCSWKFPVCHNRPILDLVLWTDISGNTSSGCLRMHHCCT